MSHINGLDSLGDDGFEEVDASDFVDFDLGAELEKMAGKLEHTLNEGGEVVLIHNPNDSHHIIRETLDLTPEALGEVLSSRMKRRDADKSLQVGYKRTEG